MRAFIVLCLVAAACAQSGYNYHQGFNGGSSGGPSYGSASSISPSSAVGPSFGSGSGVGPSGGVGPSYGSGSSVSPSNGNNDGAASFDSPSFAPQNEVEKEFYTFSANDDDFIEPAASNQYANGGKQGLRVIFIKGPENNGLEDAALGLARQAAEQRTAIYVLNKQHDLSDLANKLKDANSNINNKPEVHFVKYRTPEDAANAQRAIQGQYDQLGGPSQHYNGGVAPALNFASRAPAAQQGSYGAGSAPSSSYGSAPSGSFGAGSVPAGSFGTGSAPSGSYLAPSGVSSPSANYLPASILRRFRH